MALLLYFDCYYLGAICLRVLGSPHWPDKAQAHRCGIEAQA